MTTGDVPETMKQVTTGAADPGPVPERPHGPHLTADGQFKSDKYPWCPVGFFALKITDQRAWLPLNLYAMGLAMHGDEHDQDLAADLLEAVANAKAAWVASLGAPDAS